MAKQRFIEKKFKPDSLKTITQANDIIAEYFARGQKLTLRQLYYRFVAKGLLPNTQRSYKNLGSLIDDARKAGLMDWSMIEDRTRNVSFPSAWTDAQGIMASVVRWYQEDLWITQPEHYEAWIEKEALIGVITQVCEELRIPYFACRGYVSQSEAYASGRRFFSHMLRGQRRDGETFHKKKIVILHLGDHDPSGIDMTRDIEERVRLFSEMGSEVEVRRLALNMDQIEEYNPPPNPAKVTDSRYDGYEAIHGDESWELDALEPDLIEDLIRQQVEPARDMDLWNEALEREEHYRDQLRNAQENWPGVLRYLEHRNREVDDVPTLGNPTIDELLVEMDDVEPWIRTE